MRGTSPQSVLAQAAARNTCYEAQRLSRRRRHEGDPCCVAAVVYNTGLGQHCQSSCTLFHSIRNICIEPSATLLFRAAHDDQGNPSPVRTQHMLAGCNAPLRNYLTANHFMDTLAFHAISGRDMIRRFGYPQCPR
jgi:hypothetical protein